ncbi:MAG TPA: DNA repair exonuclease [Nitrososphaera sp.]|jgi:DNA repair exonuclease SbcCD nuclease subunit|nr:DNA repair exonuclease [Nitrososphaera sp.]
MSHISDLHLGYSQFSLEEREEDVYRVFHEAIDASIKERVRLIILAGDLFHNPRPCGKAIVTLGNTLKKLKEKQIPVVFVLGEHDISRLRDVPFIHIYSNLGLARKLRCDEPFRVENCIFFGADKERRSNIDSLIENMRHAEHLAKQHDGKKVLVLHQGLADFNRFAGELNSTDLPAGFNYYALGHYHDHLEKRFEFLGGPLAYPGSIDLTPSEGIEEVDKGFIITDMSGEEPSIQWIKLESRRQQFSARIDYKDIANQVELIIKKATTYDKKPIARIEVAGSNIDSKVISEHLKKLNDFCLHYVWQPMEEHLATTVYDSKPADIDSELYRLSAEALGSDELAKFTIGEVLPLAADKDAKTVLEILWQAYKLNKFGGRNDK